ncbi:MAG: histidine phosphatase family protein [Thiothrix sp.]|nr:histidine phosphatase family protein [Thiothrix sp.]HPQ96383.1 histidine phosphatase family protein [Thiolinea sp.]
MAPGITHIDLLASLDVQAGEVFCGALDSPVNTEGMKALKKAVRRRSDWDCVFSSPLQRCAAFGDWISTRHHIPLTLEAGFDEMNFGSWEGRLPHEIMQQDHETLIRWWQDPASVCPPGGESWQAFRQRVLTAWQALLDTNPERTVLLVTHPGVVRLLVLEVLRAPSSAFFAIQVEPGVLTRIRVAREEADSGDSWATLVSLGCG